MKYFLKGSLFFLLIVVIVFSFSCGKTDGKETLKVGTNAEYPPFEYKEGTEFKGIDMDLAKLLAEKMNMKLEILDMDFDSLIPSLGANKIDLAMAAITITDERREKVDFSIPYYSVDQAIICKKEKNINIESEEELANYQIGVQNGTTGQIYIDKNLVKPGKMPQDNFNKYATNIEAITDMLNGNIDLVIIDSSAGKGYKSMKPIKIIYTIETGEEYGIGMPKNSPLKEKVNNHLKNILDSQEWNKILQEYIK